MFVGMLDKKNFPLFSYKKYSYWLTFDSQSRKNTK